MSACDCVTTTHDNDCTQTPGARNHLATKHPRMSSANVPTLESSGGDPDVLWDDLVALLRSEGGALRVGPLSAGNSLPPQNAYRVRIDDGRLVASGGRVHAATCADADEQVNCPGIGWKQPSALPRRCHTNTNGNDSSRAFSKWCSHQALGEPTGRRLKALLKDLATLYDDDAAPVHVQYVGADAGNSAARGTLVTDDLQLVLNTDPNVTTTYHCPSDASALDECDVFNGNVPRPDGYVSCTTIDGVKRCDRVASGVATVSTSVKKTYFCPSNESKLSECEVFNSDQPKPGGYVSCTTTNGVKRCNQVVYTPGESKVSPVVKVGLIVLVGIAAIVIVVGIVVGIVAGVRAVVNRTRTKPSTQNRS